MPIIDLQSASSLTALRRVNSDGTVTVVCRICGKPLYRGLSHGFSTAKCSDCAGVPTDDMVTGAITLPDGRVIYQADVQGVALLYPEKPAMEKQGLARAVFRALGFGRPKEPTPKSADSRAIAKERRRKPIFGPGEMD
jgi:hypothetical protein